MTILDVALALDITERYAAELVRRGKITGHKNGRRWVVDPDSVEALRRSYLAPISPNADRCCRGHLKFRYTRRDHRGVMYCVHCHEIARRRNERSVQA